MASITGVLSPSTEQNLELLEQQASEQPVPEVGWKDYAKASFTEAYKNSTGYSLAGTIVGSGSPVYSKEQLSELYSDVPEDYWKGSANAFQAELLYDRFKASQEREELYNLITNVSDPNKGLAADALGMGAGFAAGLSDPINIAAGYGGAALVNKTITPFLGKIAPTFMKTVAGSRFSSTVLPEIAENLTADVAFTYTAQQAGLNKFDQREGSDERSFLSTVEQSVGTAIFFGALRGLKKKAPISDGGGFTDKATQQNFNTNKDRANAATNSENANKVTYEDAIAHTATSANPNIPSSVNTRIAEATFSAESRATFDTQGTTFFGTFEKTSGISDYPGARFGDTYVFVNSADRAQGIINTYGKDSAYEVYGHRGDSKLLDLENTKSSDFPQILDKIETEFGSSVWNQLEGIGDDPSIADLFRAVNELPNPEGVSGFDVVAMFDEINRDLSTQGYDGTLYNEITGEGHQVMSIFADKIRGDQLTKLHEGKAEGGIVVPESEKMNERTEAPIRTIDGQEIIADTRIDHDPFYDEDLEFSNSYIDFNDPLTVKQITDELSQDVKIEDYSKAIKDDIRESIRQTNDRDTFYSRAEDQLAKVEERIKNDPPDKAEEFAKAVENCLRKG